MRRLPIPWPLLLAVVLVLIALTAATVREIMRHEPDPLPVPIGE